MAAGALKKWGAAATDSLVRRNVFMGELKQSGIKAPDQIAVPSVRNDAAFLTAVTGAPLFCFACCALMCFCMQRLHGNYVSSYPRVTSVPSIMPGTQHSRL